MKPIHEKMLEALEEIVKQSAIEKYCNETLPNNLVQATIVKQTTTGQEYLEVFIKINEQVISFKIFPYEFSQAVNLKTDSVESLAEAIKPKLAKALAEFLNYELAINLSRSTI